MSSLHKLLLILLTLACIVLMYKISKLDTKQEYRCKPTEKRLNDIETNQTSDKQINLLITKN